MPSVPAPASIPDPEFIAFQSAVAGEYSIERELGRGGMGIVYLAREVALDRPVAIKVLPESLSSRDDLRERFLREARMAARLSHPHIVPIFRVGEAGGFVFFAMAYVRGETLGQRLRDTGPLAPEAALRVVREVAWALAYAHGHGIVHRDVKPDNILLEADSGRALVMDFGIARAAHDDELTDPGRLMGTAHFMSPEQASSEPLDGRSDLYSLGVVAYLALSGRPPFDAPSVPALLVKHVSEPAPPLTEVAPGVPGRVAAVVEQCLRKDPAERYATGEELADALGAVSAPKRQLPMPLRVWAQQRDPLRPMYLMWSGMFAVGTLSELRSLNGDPLVTALFGCLPLLPSMVFHARKTEKALASGYTLGDLRATLKEWRTQRREELRFELAANRPLLEGLLRAITFGAFGTIGLMVLRPFSLPSAGMAGRLFALGTFLTAAAGVAASNAFGVPLFGRKLRGRLEGSMRSAFWNSEWGAWVARLLTPRHPRVAVEAASRPTEIALGVAVDDLFEALPLAQKRQLRGLPQTVRELEAQAADARRRLQELDAPVLREKAQRELTEVVSMLESIRLDLLRLHAGTSDVSPLTAVLERARELGDDLEAMHAGLKAIEAPSRTPV